MIINIACPQIGEEEIEAVTRVMRTGMLAQGPEVAAFEKEFAEFVGVKHAIATSNGSTALLVALQSLELPEGSEVITTPFTFLASASSIIFAGLKPVFVDIKEDTFCINPNLIESTITDKTKAIMPVSLYGNMCEMDEIMKLAHKYDLRVIEDAAQSHGAKYKTTSSGSIADLGCFSFYPTKNITCSEGGMITTNNDTFAYRCRLLRQHGSDVPYSYQLLGFNYRMTSISAAIGREQLKKLPLWNLKRFNNAQYYNNNLRSVITPFSQNYISPVYHQYTIKCDKRDELKQHLATHGINCGIYYPKPLYSYDILSKFAALCPVTEKVSAQVLSLPVHQNVTQEDLEKIVTKVNSFES